MGISDRLLGKKNVNGHPRIEAVHPGAALPGGEVRITGTSLMRPPELRRPRVSFGEIEGSVLISSDEFLVARVPAGASSGPVVVSTNGHTSNPHQIKVAVPIAENLHPVTNPALDAEGNIYATFSGSRGQKVQVSIYKIDTNYNAKPFVADLMNATAIAFDRAGQMYVSSRHDGAVYRVAPNGTMSTYAEGMGVATGIAFDRAENLYVGDRSGTIFKIARDRQIPPGVWASRRSFRHRADDFQLRLRLQGQSAGRGFDFLPRSRAPAGAGIRRRRKHVCRGFAFRKARNREDHSRWQGVFGGLRPGAGWTCVCTGPGGGLGYDECGPPSFVELARLAPAGRPTGVTTLALFCCESFKL